MQGSARIGGIGLFQVYVAPASSVHPCSPHLGSTVKESAEVFYCCSFLISLILTEVLSTPQFIIWLVSFAYLQVCSIMLNKAGLQGWAKLHQPREILFLALLGSGSRTHRVHAVSKKALDPLCY